MDWPSRYENQLGVRGAPRVRTPLPTQPRLATWMSAPGGDACNFADTKIVPNQDKFQVGFKLLDSRQRFLFRSAAWKVVPRLPPTPYRDLEPFQGTQLSTLSAAIGVDQAAERVRPIAFGPPFICRSLVMNCCGLSQMPGVLYPMNCAMSATKALQL